MSGPLLLGIKRWPDREARFALSRLDGKEWRSWGLSLAELRKIAELAKEVEAILAEEPHRPAYEVGDVGAIVAERRKAATQHEEKAA